MKIKAPLDEKTVLSLKAGDTAEISGTIYVARDAAHKRMVEALDRGEKLPFDPEGAVIYYMGPSPAKPGQVIGSAGPTTSGRMDPYTPRLLSIGVKGMIGKGNRSQVVKEAIQKYKAVYMAAIGGAAALLRKRIVRSEPIAYEDLGAEAVLRLEVEDFPVTVINDVHGNDLYEQGKKEWGAKLASLA